VTASSNEFGGGEAADVSRLQEAAPAYQNSVQDEMDISLLEDSLAKTPWERMQANDDALQFGELLRAAVKKRNAKPERTDPQTD
jgi:hypothetical protein